MSAPQETRRGFLRRAATAAGGALGLAVGLAPDNGRVSAAEQLQTEPFLDSAELESVLGELQSQFSGDEKFQRAIKHLDKKYDNNAERGIFVGKEWGQGGVTLPRGEYLAWTFVGREKITSSSPLTLVKSIWQYCWENPDGTPNYGLIRITVPDGATAFIPSNGGRVARLAAATIPNPALDFSPEKELARIAQQTPNVSDRIQRAIGFLDGKFNPSIGIQWQDKKAKIPIGSFLVYTTTNTPKIIERGFFSKFQEVPGFFLRSDDGLTYSGLFVASVLNDRESIIGYNGGSLVGEGRAIRIASPIIPRAFNSVIVQ